MADKCVYNPNSPSHQQIISDIKNNISKTNTPNTNEYFNEFCKEIDKQFINAKDVADQERIGMSYGNDNIPVFVFEKDTICGREDYNQKFNRNKSSVQLTRNIQSTFEFDSLFSDNLEAKQEFINQFQSDIFEAAVWNRHNNYWVDSDPDSIAYAYGIQLPFSYVNRNIIQLKCDAIHRINSTINNNARNRNFFKDCFCNENAIENLNDTQFNNFVIAAIDKALEYLNKVDRTNKQMLFDYALLKYFDVLLNKYTPFVKPKKGRINSIDLDKYEYVGGHVTHRSHFVDDENNHNSLEKDSDLADVFLNYIPTVNDDGSDDLDTVVGKNSFHIVAAEIKEALKQDNEYNDILYNQLSPESKEKFLRFLNTRIAISLPKTFNAIKKYIFNKHSNDYIFNMFFNMMLKQESSDYMETSYDNISETITSHTLKSRKYNEAAYQISNILQSAFILYFPNNEEFNNYFKNDIDLDTFNTDNVTIKLSNGKQFTIVAKSNTKKFYEIEYDKTNLDDVSIEDLVLWINNKFHAGFTLDSINNYYKDNEQKGKWDLVNFIYVGVIQNKLPRDKTTGILKNISPYRNNALGGVAEMYAKLYGRGVSSVFKNAEGNTIPAYQIGAMAEKTNLLNAIVNEAMGYDLLKKSTVNYNGKSYHTITNPLAFNLARLPIFKGVVRASSCDINGVKKSASSLNYNELQNVAMIYKFFGHIGGDNTHVVSMQPTNYSDKSTQFEALWDFDTTVTDLAGTTLFPQGGEYTNAKGEKSKFVHDMTFAEIIQLYLNVNDESIFNKLLDVLYKKWIYKYITKTYNIFMEYLSAAQLADDVDKNNMLSILMHKINQADLERLSDLYIPNMYVINSNDNDYINNLRTTALQLANNIDTLLKQGTAKRDKKGKIEKYKSGEEKIDVTYSNDYLSDLFFRSGNSYIKNVQYDNLKERQRSFNKNVLLGLQFDASTFNKYFNYQQQVMAKTMNREGVKIMLNDLPKWIQAIPTYQRIGDSKRFLWFDRYGKLKPWQSKKNMEAALEAAKNDDENITYSEISDNKLKDNESNDEVKEKYKLDDMVVCPLIRIYSLMDSMFSADFNELHLGDSDIHDCKVTPQAEKDLDTYIDEHYDDSEKDVMKLIRKYSLFKSSRIVTQNKRAIPDTTCVHSWLHGTTYGMPKTAKIALIDSIQSKTHLPNGEEQEMYAHDGGAFSCAYTQYLENWSLVDASAGRDRKTLLPGLVPKNLGAQLGKWAVFSIDNDRRRMGYNSNDNLELMFKKSTSLQFKNPNKTASDFAKKFNAQHDRWYFKDVDGKYGTPNKYYYVQSINHAGDNQLFVRYVQCNKYGRPLEDSTTVSKSIEINSLYDIDQMLGGAWSMKMNYDTNTLEYSEDINEFISRFICEYDLKDNFIHYVADKEAVKVGIGNVNSIKRYRDENQDLMYMDISTMLGGLIMDAEHESDATVSEMSQMINLLDQNGNMHTEVYQLYEEIGRIILESVNVYQEAIDQKLSGSKRDALYRLIGRSLIQSFMKNDRDIISMAKTFVSIAQTELNRNNIKFQLPFSSATINDSFVSVISSDIVKNVIRRRYYGMQGVLTPSYDMIMVYQAPNGEKMLFDKYVEYIQSIMGDVSYRYEDSKPWWKHFMNDYWVKDSNGEDIRNPLIQDINANELQFGDSVYDPTNPNSINNNGFIEVNTIDQYEYYKYQFGKGKLEVHRGKPRNLGQCKLNYTVFADDKAYTFDEYSLDSNRIAFQLRKKSESKIENEELVNLGVKFKNNLISNPDADNLYRRLLQIISKYKGKPYVNLNDISRTEVLQILEDETNTMLRLIQDHDEDVEIPMQLSWKQFGDTNLKATTVKVSKPTFNAFEIVMSKQNISKLGLNPNDDINDIINAEEKSDNGKGYFYNKIKESFMSLPADNNMAGELYDAVIWIDERPVMVKLNTEINQESEEGDLVSSDIALTNSCNRINENIDSPTLQFRIRSNSSFVDAGDGYLYYNDERFIKNDGIHVSTIINGEIGSIDVIVVNSLRQFNQVLRNRNVKIYKYNYNQKNINILELPEGVNSVDQATVYENDRLEQTIIEQGKLRYQSFLQSLNMLGTRIPSSSMQSFSVMKVVAQTNSGLNDVYVPSAINLISGSDFDIDKQYLMEFSLDDNGILYLYTNLVNTKASMNDMMQLPLPTNKAIQSITELNDSDLGKVTSETYILSDSQANHILDEWNNGNVYPFIDLLNKINSKNYQYINAGNNDYTNELTDLINTHNLSRLTKKQRSEALKNRVVSRVINIMGNAKNYLNMHKPIDMDPVRESAQSVNFNHPSNESTEMNATTKFFSQVNSILGKECVGIEANANKTFNILTIFFNQKCDEKILDIRKKQEEDSDGTHVVYEVLDYLKQISFDVPYYTTEELDSKTKKNPDGNPKKWTKFNFPAFENSKKSKNVDDDHSETEENSQDEQKKYEHRIRMATILNNLNINKLINIVEEYAAQKGGNTLLESFQLDDKKKNSIVSQQTALSSFIKNFRLDALSNKLPVQYTYNDVLIALYELRRKINKVDSVLNISALINSATDNAKELTLAKINATQDTIDIYNALIMAGIPIKETVKIMKSNIMDKLIIRSKKDMFHPESMQFNLQNMISMYRGNDTLPFINKNKFIKIIEEYLNFYDTRIRVMYNNILKEILPEQQYKNLSDEVKNEIIQSWIDGIEIEYIKKADRNKEADKDDITSKFKIKNIKSSCKYASQLNKWIYKKESTSAKKSKKSSDEVTYEYGNLAKLLTEYNKIVWYKLDDTKKQFFKTEFTGEDDKPIKDKFYEFIRSYEHLNDSWKNKPEEEQNKRREELHKMRLYAYEDFVRWINDQYPDKSWKNPYGTVYFNINNEGDYEEWGAEFGGSDDVDLMIDEMLALEAEEMDGTNTSNKNVTLTKKDYRNAIMQMRYFAQARTDLENAGPNATAIMKYVDAVHDMTEEISIISSYGKINQGIDTNSRDAYAFVKRINDYFNNKLALKNYNSKKILPIKGTKSTEGDDVVEIMHNGRMVKARPQLVKTYYDNSFDDFRYAFFTSDLFADDRFDIYRLLDNDPKNDEYKKHIMEVCDSYKHIVNIADLMLTVPHFREMSKSLLLARKILSASSIKYNIENDFVSLLPNQKYTLKEDEYKRVSELANGYLISQFLKHNGSGIKMQYKDALVNKIYNNGELNEISKDQEIPVQSIDQIATFKYFMERHVIPKLKDTYVDNYFIQSLWPTIKINRRLKTYRLQYKLPVNMGNIADSPELQYTFDELSKSLEKVADQPVDGLVIYNDKTGNNDQMKIADALFLYNLIVNQDKFGQASMTNLFIKYVNNNNFFVNKYYKYLSDLDKNADRYADSKLNHKIQKVDIKMRRMVQALFYDNADMESHFYIKTQKKDEKKGEELSVVNLEFINKYGNKISRSKILKNINGRYNDYTLGVYEEWMYADEIKNNDLTEAEAQDQQDIAEQLSNDNLQPNDLLSRINSAVQATFGDNVIFNTNDSSDVAAYIEDGKIYLNTNCEDYTWTTPVHELSHLICAYIKFNNDPQIRQIYQNWLDAITNVYFMSDANNGLKWKNEYFKSYWAGRMPEAFYGDDINSVDYREEMLVHLFENNIKDIAVDGIQLNMEDINLSSILSKIFDLNNINPNTSMGQIMKGMQDKMIEYSDSINLDSLKLSNTVKLLRHNIDKKKLMKYICK